MRPYSWLLALLSVVSAVPCANATTINSVFNTGSGGSSGSTDPNWAIAYLGPTGVTPPVALPTFVTDTTSTQFASWLADNLPTYGWITPQQVYGSKTGDAAGVYTFTTTFFIAANPTTAQLQFRYTVDNSLTAVLLNGVNVSGISLAGGLASLSATQTISSGFVSGLNTLTFDVVNGAGKNNNPVGLLVDFTSATEGPVVPEPATFGLVGIALTGLTLVKRRRERRVAQPKESDRA